MPFFSHSELKTQKHMHVGKHLSLKTVESQFYSERRAGGLQCLKPSKLLASSDLHFDDTATPQSHLH